MYPNECRTYAGDANGTLLDDFFPNSYDHDGVHEVDLLAIADDTRSNAPGFSGYSPQIVTQRLYNPSSEALVQETQWIDHAISGFAETRGLDYPGTGRAFTTTATSNNFMGQPLSRTMTEGMVLASGGTTTTRTATVDYAYWGKEKYYQQKAVRDQAGRYSYTDYYANTAAAGSRGQTYRVYDPKNAGFVVDSSLPAPAQAQGQTTADYQAKLWKYQLRPSSATAYSAQFAYDAQGRPTDVWKLQSATTSPWKYVQTHTSYAGDGSPAWGQASVVVEDLGGIGRTTQTNAYTSWGKASDVTDAAGHRFVTDFDLDGLVNSVRRTDSGLSQAVVRYGYGSGIANGQPVSVTDGLSGVVQTIGYATSGGGLGMPASVTETNGSDSYSVSYAYSGAGDRATATYATPQGTGRWGYSDYLTTEHSPTAPRAFKTLTRLDASGNPTAEAFHYAYDSAGRLQAAAFAQSPYVDGSHQGFAPAAGAPFYDATHPASRRARALYAYDAGGRLTEVATNWDALPDGGGAYAVTGVADDACAYETSGAMNRGLKTSSAFTVRNDDGSYASRTEAYGYDASLDYLTSASYGDGLPNASPTWGYDAAGNRSDAVVDNLNRATSLGGVAVTSDVLGNRLTKGGVTYGWDCLNRMTSLSGSAVASYAYRADGMRVWKSTGGVSMRYRHDGQMGIEDVETPATGNPTVTRYGLGARGVDLIERTVGSTVTLGFPVYDAHGNNVATLSRNGSGGFSLGDRRSYDAWGVVRSQRSGGDPKLRYCASLGHKADDESGLIYMRARYYEPGSGRFSTPGIFLAWRRGTDSLRPQ